MSAIFAPRRVRSTSDSGEIAAAQQTDVEGTLVQQVSFEPVPQVGVPDSHHVGEIIRADVDPPSVPVEQPSIVGTVIPRQSKCGPRRRADEAGADGWAATLLPPANHGFAGPADVASSVITLKPASVHGPNEVTIATSVASRPRAIRMRPMRGLLWRASNVYQRSPR
jgi:hypothetical protein